MSILLLSPADSTGTHSLYTTYQGYEVMFHVSTMLPYMPNNPQQVNIYYTPPPKCTIGLQGLCYRSNTGVCISEKKHIHDYPLLSPTALQSSSIVVSFPLLCIVKPQQESMKWKLVTCAGLFI